MGWGLGKGKPVVWQTVSWYLMQPLRVQIYSWRSWNSLAGSWAKAPTVSLQPSHKWIIPSDMQCKSPCLYDNKGKQLHILNSSLFYSGRLQIQVEECKQCTHTCDQKTKNKRRRKKAGQQRGTGFIQEWLAGCWQVTPPPTRSLRTYWRESAAAWPTGYHSQHQMPVTAVCTKFSMPHTQLPAIDCSSQKYQSKKKKRQKKKKKGR